MKYKKVVAEVIKSNIYNRIIQVNVPTRFYWNENGFDGIEFGPIPKITKHQLQLLDETLTSIGYILKNKKTPIPGAFLKAFKEGKQKGDN